MCIRDSAGIIAMQPECIVLDEPTAMLDPRGREEVLRTIHKLNREKGITIVLITHYMDEAVQAGRVVVMDDGQILLQGTPKEVFSHVELLKQHKLDVPQATELIYRLRASGYPLPECVLNEEDCVAAVSYTHLDVYKRQVAQRGGDPLSGDGGLCAGHHPVSYTHLDVYKRQG